MLQESHCFAWWLFCHPGVRVYGHDHKTLFWYDEDLHKFFCQKPSNKVRNGVHEALGLTTYFQSYCKMLSSADFLS